MNKITKCVVDTLGEIPDKDEDAFCVGLEYILVAISSEMDNSFLEGDYVHGCEGYCEKTFEVVCTPEEYQKERTRLIRGYNDYLCSVPPHNPQLPELLSFKDWLKEGMPSGNTKETDAFVGDVIYSKHKTSENWTKGTVLFVSDKTLVVGWGEYEFCYSNWKEYWDIMSEEDYKNKVLTGELEGIIMSLDSSFTPDNLSDRLLKSDKINIEIK